MRMKRKIVVTLSGGMDSAVLLFKAAKIADEVHTISFDYGQRHKRELECVKKQLADVKSLYPETVFHNKLLDTTFIREMAPVSSLTNDNINTPNVNEIMGEAQPKSYVPFRNLMFLSMLCSYAEAVEAHEVWYGAAQADSLAGYWDGSEEFVEQLNSVTALNRENRITVKAPLIEMSKKDIVLDGVSLGVNFSNTYTCYSGEYPCDAESASSSLRLQGFVEANLRDPLEYTQQDKLDAVYEKNGCKAIET